MNSFLSSQSKKIPSMLGGLRSWGNDPNPKRQSSDHKNYSYSDGGYWHLLKKGIARSFRWLTRDDNWKWVVTTFVIAGIAHILTVFAIPEFAPKSAWSRLKDVPVNTMQQVPRLDEKNAPIALLSPDMRYAFCRYDISKGPLYIKSKVPNDLFTITFYNQIGQNFYIIFGSDLQRGKLNLILANKNSLADAEAKEADSSDDLVVVQAEQNKGIAILSAPVTGPAYEKTMEEIFAGATCQVK